MIGAVFAIAQFRVGAGEGVLGGQPAVEIAVGGGDLFCSAEGVDGLLKIGQASLTVSAQSELFERESETVLDRTPIIR